MIENSFFSIVSFILIRLSTAPDHFEFTANIPMFFVYLCTSGGSWNFSLGGQSFEELGVVRDSCGSHTQKWY